tara:strand:- start:1680 stop:2501 length:822 start_codon:yes stop_codon:yes gene_type:complete
MISGEYKIFFMKEIFVSVLILNYNNGKFLDRCIKSCLNQTYKNFEILVYDDKSSDNSLLILKKYKKRKIKITINKSKKTGIAAFDAKNGYYRLIKKSKGTIMFLLDSDDYFKKNKISQIVRIYKKNDKFDFIQDLPLIIHTKQREKKIGNSNFSFWPYLAPESCISFRKKFFKDFFLKNKSDEKKYPNVWLGFRLGVYAYFVKNSFHTIKKNLTIYKSYGESKKYRFLSYNWFIRRFNSYKYLESVCKEKKLFKFSLDYSLTRIVVGLLKIFK